MSNVTAIQPKGDRGAAILLMDDGSKVWTPDIEKAKSLLNQPIPPTWRMTDGDYGPQAFPPREARGGGGMSAWRNTKEGFLAEQQGRLAWQREDEDRKDRRTALMQAVALAGQLGLDTAGLLYLEDVVATSNAFYAWLRKTSGSPTRAASAEPPSGPGGPDPTSSPSLAPLSGDENATGGGSVLGKGAAAPCSHSKVSDLKPDGKPLPKGRLRCDDCGTVLNESEVA